MVFAWVCYVVKKTLFFHELRSTQGLLDGEATSHYSIFRIEADDKTGSIGLSNVHLARTPRTDFLQEDTWKKNKPLNSKMCKLRVVLNLELRKCVMELWQEILRTEGAFQPKHKESKGGSKGTFEHRWSILFQCQSPDVFKWKGSERVYLSGRSPRQRFHSGSFVLIFPLYFYFHLFQWSVLKKVIPILRKIAEKLWGGIMPKRFFPFYLLLVLVAGHFTNEFFVRGLDPGKSDKMLKIWTQLAVSWDLSTAIVQRWSFRHWQDEYIIILYIYIIYTY